MGAVSAELWQGRAVSGQIVSADILGQGFLVAHPFQLFLDGYWTGHTVRMPGYNNKATHPSVVL